MRKAFRRARCIDVLAHLSPETRLPEVAGIQRRELAILEERAVGVLAERPRRDECRALAGVLVEEVGDAPRERPRVSPGAGACTSAAIGRPREQRGLRLEDLQHGPREPLDRPRVIVGCRRAERTCNELTGEQEVHVRNDPVAAAGAAEAGTERSHDRICRSGGRNGHHVRGERV